jgi:hypothetical protein
MIRVRFAHLTKILPIAAVAAIAFTASAQTTFDVEGATEIYPTAITATGATAGYYATTAPVSGYGKDFYGFIRDAAGTITTFSTPAYSPNSSSTVVWGMNSSGVIVGESYIQGLSSKGYIRATNGTFTLINPAGFGNTSARAINDSGQATGTVLPSSAPYHSHGFLYSAGAVTIFDVPNPSKTITTVDTYAETIDSSGNIAGAFADSTGAYHIFLRNNKGRFTTYDIPGARSVVVTRLNTSGQIGGRYWNGSQQIGFVLSTSGKKTLNTFFSPYAVVNTGPNDMNNLGVATGNYWDGSQNHGFLWKASTGFSYFDMPSSTGTVPLAINDSTVSTGYFFDTLGAAHGFIY